MNKSLLAALCLAGASALSGCATIVGDSSQSVVINTTPSGADYTVKDEAGQVVSQGKTPGTILLKKSNGSYFGGKDYVVTFHKDGYSDTTQTIKSSMNGWYIGGNIVFGGLIGWLAVDPFNGGMWTMKPDTVNAPLAAN